MNRRECSFRGVRIGEVFVPVSEFRTMHNYVLAEERDGKVVKFRRVKKPGVFRFEHNTFSKWGGEPKSVMPEGRMDNRLYVKTSEHLSEDLNTNVDAIFGATDRVIVLDHIDDMLKEVA